MMSDVKEEKQYGLILPKKPQVSALKPTNVFGNDDCSDEEEGGDWVRKALKAESERNKLKKQTKLNMQKALNEDPTIYQYDEVYDDMERKKLQQKSSIKAEEKKPRYIQNLLKAAERRKKEQEHRIERMVQKEREAEGNMYADKESFVTSAYRAKLEEFKQMEEEEARMERLEAIGDVTKQQDMSGFYRHLYEQTVENPAEVEENVNAETSKPQNSSNESASTNTNAKNLPEKREKNKRQYRQRAIETYESDSEDETTCTQLNGSKKDNISSNETTESNTKKRKRVNSDKEISTEEEDKTSTNENTPKILEEKPQDTTEKEITDIAEEPTTVQDGDNNNVQNDENDAVDKSEKSREKKERSSIWEKRTVGPVFEAALQRYYARKAMKLSGV